MASQSTLNNNPTRLSPEREMTEAGVDTPPMVARCNNGDSVLSVVSPAHQDALNKLAALMGRVSDLEQAAKARDATLAGVRKELETAQTTIVNLTRANQDSAVQLVQTQGALATERTQVQQLQVNYGNMQAALNFYALQSQQGIADLQQYQAQVGTLQAQVGTLQQEAQRSVNLSGRRLSECRRLRRHLANADTTLTCFVDGLIQPRLYFGRRASMQRVFDLLRPYLVNGDNTLDPLQVASVRWCFNRYGVRFEELEATWQANHAPAGAAV